MTFAPTILHIVDIGVGFEFDRHGKPISNLNWFYSELKEVIRKYGGYTQIETTGGWLNPDTLEVVVEKGRTIRILAEHGVAYADLRETAIDLGRSLNQHSVVFAAGASAEIVPIDYPRDSETA